MCILLFVSEAHKRTDTDLQKAVRTYSTLMTHIVVQLLVQTSHNSSNLHVLLVLSTIYNNHFKQILLKLANLIIRIKSILNNYPFGLFSVFQYICNNR